MKKRSRVCLNYSPCAEMHTYAYGCMYIAAYGTHILAYLCEHIIWALHIKYEHTAFSYQNKSQLVVTYALVLLVNVHFHYAATLLHANRDVLEQVIAHWKSTFHSYVCVHVSAWIFLHIIQCKNRKLRIANCIK